MLNKLTVVLIILVSVAIRANVCADLFDDPNLSLDKLLDVTVSSLLGQKSQDSSVTPEFYKTFLLNDNTNEDIATFSAQQILARSGYQYENHYVTSDDGYITNLIRIVNPLADASQLKQPPVMMMHGALIDSTCWLWNSAIQHQPEKYPRVAADGPITSWNKSLAFVLANNGYDVWLVGTRGSNIQNKRHAKLTKHYNLFEQVQLAEDGQLDGSNFQMDYEQNFRYWNYSMDDIGQFEVPRQQQKILELTGAEKVTLIDYSQSTQFNLAQMTENRQFVSRLHSYVTFAPVLNREGINRGWILFHETACTRIPLRLGVLLAQLVLSRPVQQLVATINIFKELRYSLVKTLTRSVLGPSAKYETNQDSGVVGHIFASTGYKQFRHYCQQVRKSRLQKYDFGPTENLRLYGSLEPPEYNLANIDYPPWLLVSGGNDILSTVSSNNQLLSSVRRQPTRHVYMDRYNHADLTAAVESDKYINLPVLDFLDQLALAPRQS